MVGNILKTIGICLTSLGSFNIQEQRAEDPTWTTTNTEIHVLDEYANLNQFQVSGNPDQGTGYTDYWEYLGSSTKSNCRISYIYRFQRFTNPQGNVAIGLYPDSENVYLTLTMLMIKIEATQGTLGQANFLNYYENIYTKALGESQILNANYAQYIYTNDTISQYFQPLTTTTSFMYSNIVNKMTTINSYTYDRIYYGLEPRYLSNVIYDNYSWEPIYDADETNNLVPITPEAPTYILLVNRLQGSSLEQEELNGATLANDPIFTIQVKTTNASVDYEVVDVPGVMFEVLTMPFTFISTAFNLTLFPGTPYQLNLSNLFLAIIGIMTFIFIMKMIISRL